MWWWIETGSETKERRIKIDGNKEREDKKTDIGFILINVLILLLVVGTLALMS